MIEKKMYKEKNDSPNDIITFNCWRTVCAVLGARVEDNASVYD